MEQLTSLDAWFINENDSVFQHFCDVLVFDRGSAELSLEKLRGVVLDRIHLVPPMRRRLVELPFGMDEPYWIDDPSFDIDDHLHVHTLAGPGDDHQLADLVAEIASTPLDRSRPLWELHLVHGLAEGRSALVRKLHHAAFDGSSGLQVTSALLDPTSEVRTIKPPTEPWTPDAEPSLSELFARGMMGMAFRPFKMAQAQHRMLQRAGSRPDAPTATDPITSAPVRQNMFSVLREMFTPVTPVVWNAPVTAARGVSFARVDRDVVARIKSAARVRFNDVIVAICAGALRDWLLARGELPDDALRVCVPISTRTEEQSGMFGNRVSMLFGDLPTHLADPMDRLHATSASMATAKEAHAVMGPDMLTDLGIMTMPAAQARANRAAASMRMPTFERPLQWNVAVTNVAGPSEPMYLVGNRLVAHYPVGMLGANQGLFVSAISYLDSVQFGLIVAPELIPDVWELSSAFTNAAQQLERAAGVGAQPKAQESGAKEPDTNGSQAATTGKAGRAGAAGGSGAKADAAKASGSATTARAERAGGAGGSETKAGAAKAGDAKAGDAKASGSATTRGSGAKADAAKASGSATTARAERAGGAGGVQAKAGTAKAGDAKASGSATTGRTGRTSAAGGVQAKAGTAKAGDAKADAAKADAAKASGSATTDSAGRTGAAGGSEAKAGTAKAGDAKAGDAKAGDGKAGDGKAGTAKAGAAKASGSATAEKATAVAPGSVEPDTGDGTSEGSTTG